MNNPESQTPPDTDGAEIKPMRLIWLTQEEGKKPHKIGFVKDGVNIVKPVLMSGDTIIIKPGIAVHTADGYGVAKMTGTVLVQTAMRDTQFKKLTQKKQEELRKTTFTVPDDTEENDLQILFRAFLADATIECVRDGSIIITYKNVMCPLIIHDVEEVTVIEKNP